VVGFHLDVSERKEIEELGVVAEDRLEQLTGSGGVAVFDLDFVNGRAWTSAAWQELSGSPVEHPEIGTFTQHLPDAQGDLALFLSNFGGNESWGSGPATLRRSDRRDTPILLGLHRQVSRRGELNRVLGYAVHAPAAASRQTTPPLPAGGLNPGALDALQEGVIVTDARARIRYFNAKAAAIVGIEPQAAIGQPLNEVFRLVNATSGNPADDAIDLALAAESEPRLTSDHAVMDQEDNARPIAWIARQLRDDKDTISGVVIAFRDPQEMTLTPEELIRANRFDALGQLAGGIAHDFNNLLSTILGGVSIAKENRDYDKLGDAEEACMTAKTLTRQLLAFARGNPGGTYTVVKPADILRDAVRIAAAGSPARIVYEIDEKAGPVEVDRGQILQVFQNLIINALQAMTDPSGGVITLRCRNVQITEGQLPPLEAGNYTQFEVADNGAGIPPEVVDRIFEPFFTTKKTGTGLGLATVLSIVRKHGGQLGVDSTVGVGTTFTAFIPVTERPIETGVRKPAALRFGTGRVLLMDDDPQLCEITGTMLAGLDYKYDIAHNGEEALALYRRYHNVNRPYDVVMLDLTIVGGMGGEETFRKLKEIDPDVRAVISSGYDNEEMAREYLDQGFCGYLTKPYRVGELGKMLKGVLGG